MSTVYNIGRLSTFLASQTCTRLHMQSPAKFFLYEGNFFFGQFFCDEVSSDSGQNAGDKGKGKKNW